MSKIESALWQDYNDVSNRMKGLEVNSNEYFDAVKEKDEIRNELLKLEQINNDTMVKVSQIEAENKREKVRNRITIGTFVVSTGVSLYAICKTFKFDQVATVTSTLGRNILNGVVPKMLKR